jgi:hypothetical protein
MKTMYQLLMRKEQLMLGRSNILSKRRIEKYVFLKVQSQGLKKLYLKSLFIK